MMDYVEYQAQDRRLAILIILRGVHERRANQYVLRRALKDVAHDELVYTVVNDIMWLAKQGLVKTESLGGGILMAIITDYGDQVARGVARAAGVAVPAEE
jgi:hypothetical protein